MGYLYSIPHKTNMNLIVYADEQHSKEKVEQFVKEWAKIIEDVRSRMCEICNGWYDWLSQDPRLDSKAQESLFFSVFTLSEISCYVAALELIKASPKTVKGLTEEENNKLISELSELPELLRQYDKLSEEFIDGFTIITPIYIDCKDVRDVTIPDDVTEVKLLKRKK